MPVARTPIYSLTEGSTNASNFDVNKLNKDCSDLGDVLVSRINYILSIYCNNINLLNVLIITYTV